LRISQRTRKKNNLTIHNDYNIPEELRKQAKMQSYCIMILE